MDERERKGYAKLLRDLAVLNSQKRWEMVLQRGYGAIQELDSLIDRVRKLAHADARRKRQPLSPVTGPSAPTPALRGKPKRT